MKKTLYVTVGLPRSGKSTWAKKNGNPIVNPDSIRLALHGQRFAPQAESFVWAMAFLMIDALFLAGHHTVIVDACHATEKRRLLYREKYDGRGINVVFQFFRTPKEVCIERARGIGDPEIIPVIERMAAEQDFMALPDMPEAS